MSRIYRILAAVALGALCLCGCTKTEDAFSTDGKTPLQAPTLVAGEVTTSSIAFSWNAVSDAGQYYYKVVNPGGYIASKGFTEDTEVTVKGLKYSTEFTIYLSAVPSASTVKTKCSSEAATLKMTTDSPIIIDYEWVQDGVAYFYADDDTWNKSNVTFGLEKGTNHFIVTSWCGSDGFDLYFDITDFDGTYPIEFSYGTPVFWPVIGQAIDQSGPLGDRGDIELGHGLGGKDYDYVYWYGNGASYDYGLIDPSGGYIDFWCLDYTGTWCGYRVEYGEYEPTPDPDPVPDPDAEESWDGAATISLNGEEVAETTISFDAETGCYTVSAWYGVEGYDLVFTRNAETGDWIIDPECSAYAETDEEGRTGLYHGLGRAKNSICWVSAEAWDSGLSGDAGVGNVYALITGPDGEEEAAYSCAWNNQAANSPWTGYGTAYYGDAESGDLTPITSTTISYDPVSGQYVIKAFYGVEGYDLVFTVEDGNIILDSQYVSGSVPVGFSGSSYNCCYFYDYNWLTGTYKKGNVELWMYNPDGAWCGYYFYWDNTPSDDNVWYATGNSFFSDDRTMDCTATLKFDPETQTYTIYGWWGVEGYDLTFKVAETGEIIPLENLYETNGEAVSVPHGLEGQMSECCTFYTTAGYSYFSVDERYGYAWIYDPNSNWNYWEFDF